MYVANNVTALYPKLHAPFRFDNEENRSVQCGALEDGAAYEMSFRISKEEAKPLWEYINKAWKDYLVANKKPANTKMMTMPFKDDPEDASMLIFKTKLKSAYSGQKTHPPTIYNALNQAIMDEEFRLTTGSLVDVAFTSVAYSTGVASGVSLRLKAVMVKELSETGGASSPFEADEQYANNLAKAHENMKVYEQRKHAEEEQPRREPVPDNFDDPIPF